jgi:hypothetical protein
MKEITDPGKKGHKKKTNQNKIHKDQLPLAVTSYARLGSVGEYEHS